MAGIQINQKRHPPINTKAQGISEKLRPSNLKQLRSFLGAVNQFKIFLPNLATISFRLRTILKKDAEWTWNHIMKKLF